MRTPQLVRPRARGISIHPYAVYLSGGECHQPCSGLRGGYGLVARPRLFSVRGACADTPGSSIAGLEGFLRRDVTSNGLTQLCFFEPLLPLCFYGGFDFFDFGFGFGGDSTDFGEVSEDLPQPGMFGNVQALDAFDDTPELGHAPTLANPGIPATVLAEDRNLGKDVFVLVLENGTSLAVGNYWVADGYVEYINTDGTRSHIPVEAFDLQTTVLRNALRGLTFVLRSSPDQSR